MIKCVNCNGDCRDTDKYCRNCGIRIRKSFYYILMNILITIFTIILILTLLLLIVSYIIK